MANGLAMLLSSFDKLKQQSCTAAAA